MIKPASSPPPAAAPVRRSGASAAAPCRRPRGAPDALWSMLSERLHARAPSSPPGVSAAPPPDTKETEGGFTVSFELSVHVFESALPTESKYFFVTFSETSQLCHYESLSWWSDSLAASFVKMAAT